MRVDTPRARDHLRRRGDADGRPGAPRTWTPCCSGTCGTPTAACTEVGDFTRAVEMAAQTALRDAIGRASAAEVAIRREQLDRELKRVLEEKVAPWGVTVLSVEVRDILLPEGAARGHDAWRPRPSSARRPASSSWRPSTTSTRSWTKWKSSSATTRPSLRLRTMHLLNESLREGKGTVVIPSAFAEGFNEGLGDLLKG